MTQEEKAKAYDEALENARKLRDDYQKELDKTDKNSQLASILKASISAVEMVFPQVTESDDERIRKELIEFLTDIKEISESGRTVWAVREEDVEMCKSSIAYLEKQKYNRMQPVYDNQESFESALDKAWKAYNDCGSRTVDSCEDDYIESAYAKGFREGYLFGLEKQKEQKPKAKAKSPLSPHELYDAKIEGISQGRQDVLDHPEQFGLQKPDWSEEDEKMLENIRYALRYACSNSVIDEQTTEYVMTWLKSLRPQPEQEWSEEDEQLLGFIYDLLADSLWNSRYAMSRDECLDRLTSLRQRLQPRPSWKPSEEQIEALVAATLRYQSTGLESLYEDLKKLKYE